MTTKILILGANGMFGTSMQRACLEKRIDFVALTHQDFDITKPKDIEVAVERYTPQIVINSAAMLGIPSCEENPLKAFQVNSVAALYLARILEKRKIILVQTSTNAIFDGEKKDFYFEDDIPNPRNVYGLSKYAGEISVENSIVTHYIVRFPKLFGSRKNETLGFTDKMIERMRRGEELKIADDRFDPFTYALHAARKILDLLHEKRDFGIYHVANKGSVSYYEFACRFAEKVGYTGRITVAKDRDFPASAPNPLRTELDSKKIKDMPPWEEALEEYVRTERIRL